MDKNREVPIIVVRKKAPAHGHHGGAWKVAFADFMTAMFAMFLVLWLINQSSDVKSAIAGYFQDPLGRADEFGSSIMKGDGAQASAVRPLQQSDVVEMRRDRLQKMADNLKNQVEQVPDLKDVADKVEIRVTDEGLEVQLLEDSLGVFFGLGSSTPSLRGREVLALLGHELGKLENPVLVTGYTDARPYHRADGYSNWELSADRANAARRILNLNGVDDGLFKQIRGLADRDLRVPADPFSASNRRVTITMLYPVAGDAPGDSTATAAGGADSTAAPAAPGAVTGATRDTRASAADSAATLRVKT